MAAFIKLVTPMRREKNNPKLSAVRLNNALGTVVLTVFRGISATVFIMHSVEYVLNRRLHENICRQVHALV